VGEAETSDPSTWNEVLHAEISQLRPGLFGPSATGVGGAGRLEAAKFSDAAEDRANNLKDFYGRIATLSRHPHGPLAALCLSGGGIRSATFNLGVLQGLARIGLLEKFDYLSSVSGGGYIAGWLRTWIYRASQTVRDGIPCDGLSEVVKQLGARCQEDPLSPEPEPLDNLREFSNYLTPRVGLFSGDTWAAAAIICRNILLNWLVLVPPLSAIVAVPLLFLLVTRAGLPESWHRDLLATAVGIELIASLLVYGFRRVAKISTMRQGSFVLSCVLPICLAAGALSMAGLSWHLPWRDPIPHPCCTNLLPLGEFAAVWCILVPVIGWASAEVLALLRPEWTRPRLECEKAGGHAGAAAAAKHGDALSARSAAPRDVRWVWELIGLIVSGGVGALLLMGAVIYWLSLLYNRPALYVIFTLPILLGIYLISRALFVALASLGESGTRRRSWFKRSKINERLSDLVFSEDADREWWARVSGWVLLVVVVWMAITGICLLGSYIPDALAGSDRLWPSLVATVKWLVAAIGGASGLVAALIGSSARTSGAPDAPLSTLAKKALALAAPLLVMCLIILLAWGVKALGQWVTDEPRLFGAYWDKNVNVLLSPVADFITFLCVIPALAVFGLAMGSVVNINRFSLHGMYRNRLVRAYLGASNCVDRGHPRMADPFTGFAMSDNVALHALCPDPKSVAAAALARSTRPLPIINATLNLVGGDKLAWQQRKAESFSMTPLYCGSWSEGYRPSDEYGAPGGITVGTAVTISGAAANPNRGYSSSLVLSLLMAIFNVRLGAWLGNPNPCGKNTYKLSGPRQSILLFFAEMFGLTNSHRAFVNLSDGGHFENLGLYEVVLRRCRYVLLSDADADESFSFGDLGNAIRKIRIDFGIDIDFERKIEILPNASDKNGLYCAIARIRYSQIDRSDPEDDGHLIYIKPSLRGDARKDQVLPYDIYSYGRSSSEFPHESTADQWFTESQFESYRALGSHILDQISERPYDSPLCDCSFAEFLEVVSNYVHSREKPFEPRRRWRK
jgi:hypothetical protein